MVTALLIGSVTAKNVVVGLEEPYVRHRFGMTPLSKLRSSRLMPGLRGTPQRGERRDRLSWRVPRGPGVALLRPCQRRADAHTGVVSTREVSDHVWCAPYVVKSAFYQREAGASERVGR